MNGFLLVFLGAGIGGALRHGVNLAALRLTADGVGHGTFAVNIVGCLAMGVLIEYLALEGQLGQSVRLFLFPGVLGGFTTFSAFSMDAVLLYERGEAGLAALYALASVGISIGALAAGLFLVRQIAAGTP